MTQDTYSMNGSINAKSAACSVEVHQVGNQYEAPAPEPLTSFSALKDRIRHHYELASDYYLALW